MARWAQSRPEGPKARSWGPRPQHLYCCYTYIATARWAWEMFSVILGNSLMKCERSIFDRGWGSSVVLTAPKYGLSSFPSLGIDFQRCRPISREYLKRDGSKNSVFGFGIESKLRIPLSSSSLCGWVHHQNKGVGWSQCPISYPDQIQTIISPRMVLYSRNSDPNSVNIWIFNTSRRFTIEENERNLFKKGVLSARLSGI